MVAYSFKQRFVEPIEIGLQPGPWMPGMKRQTIRADRKRHAQAGEEIQLYRGMRTQQCFLIGRSVCQAIKPIWLSFGGPPRATPRVEITGGELIRSAKALDHFARCDGFADWAALDRFWRDEHEIPGRELRGFIGVIIYWGAAA